MDLRLARSFLVVAEEAHFGRAAARLHIAQPALSHQIRQLEKQLGTTLFDRTTRRVSLTAAGERLAPRAARLLAFADDLDADMDRFARGYVGSVTVGFVGTATYDLLPRLALLVREQLPDVELTLRGELLNPDLLAGLHDHNFDLVVHRPAADIPSGLHTEVLRTEPLVAVLPAGHRLAGAKRIQIGQLAGESFVMHPAGGRSSMHEEVLAACQAAGFRPSVTLEVAETATMVVFVAAGLGVALVPRPVQALGLDGVRYVPLRAAPSVDLLLSSRPGDSGATSRVAHLLKLALGTRRPAAAR